MPVETLHPSDGRLAAAPFTSAMPFRILHKGPDYFRRQAEPVTRKLSAVERLEADKAKYVKSQQVALTRQAPVKPPIIRKPLVPPAMILQCHMGAPPARKVLRCPASVDSAGTREGSGGRRGPPLNLDILNNLINDVCEGPLPSSQSSSSTSPSSSSPSSGAKSIGSSLSAEHERSSRLLNNLKPQSATTSSSTSSCTSSPLNPSHRPPPIPARAPRIFVPSAYVSPNTVTVRRVDVRPHAEFGKPQRPRLRPRQTAQGQVPHPQVPPPPPPAPQNPAQSKSNTTTRTMPSPPSHPAASPMLVRAGMIPPASPAFTRLSNASSKGSARKHPSLHRSKSDLSDRYSRATADLERFFNYCGLDPDEVEGMGGVERFTRANSDIVSISKMRSVSTPSSECADEVERGREDYEDDDEDGPARGNQRVPYGISVIERNARVIKWLYGIRQARDANGPVSNV
ncbi:protein FAM110B [Corythoichthys intestinalis]|uniref:protein FAM110B n=1 Tax=Corythoichthys intestinalis TaxID=161448 RepID=UPI0025A50E88|nr:protein FAM110B [Corythoichthys intestinalis]XP_057686496.1 protein FAM110B [Corythoichthys intestinalis]XP_057686497.1 protein FAM110B [Corythoichthys intestinalis]XP_057686498.1 protein FAM110B [Corythoichthys intestinalis]XP_057686499.1 protein FAM110B [Corythoichthys intestinalis]XP_057686500.1 protein FAM110B [Corythoichthys intestinalis]XP_057686501.1 protein FAM110B [Corythoichthys intestinalis]XP_057686502.1 protein FAM110B [Corythoichthys intestinalis]XP_057686503.1 protein FAM1